MTTKNIRTLGHYSLLHSPNPYRIYQLANSSVTVNMLSNGQIQFIVSIGIGDPVKWMVAINAKHDHNQGTYGGDYPYAVEGVLGQNNTTFYRTANSGYYWPDDYSAVLKLAGVGDVDFATFTVGGTAPCQPPRGQKYCNNNLTRCQWNQSTCNYDCFGCPSGYQCSNGDCISSTQPPTQPPGKYIIHWKIFNGSGGKVNVYRNGSLFGTIIGSSVQTLTFDVGDVLRYEAIPDSGWRYDGTCNDGDNSCDSSNPYQGTIAVPMEFNATSLFSPTTQPHHNICQNNICTQVTGAGTDECSNVGLSCSGISYHNICQNNICTRVAGTGTNECTNVGISCLPPTSPPPGESECPDCDLTTNYCLMGSCLPKSYVVYGGIGLLAFMMLKR